MNRFSTPKIRVCSALFRVLLAVVLSTSTLGLSAQQKGYTLRGVVLEQTKSSTPPQGLGFATISIPSLSIGTIAAKDGSFELRNVPAGKISLSVQSLGMVELDTLLTVKGDISGLRFVMRPDNFRLQEVTVTATSNAAGASTSSLISRTAMDHMQATSLSDVLSLLPGNSKENGDLVNAGAIYLRSAAYTNSNPQSPTNKRQDVVPMTSLGTSIISDGAPISNNANLQVLRPAIENVSNVSGTGVSGVAAANMSADMRNVSVDDIESVEVIRGIPSVEYGDLTSGAVIMRSKAGRSPLNVRFKTNPNVYQVSANKGLALGENNGNLNLSGDYAYSVNRPTESYAYYQRVNLKGLYSNTFFRGKLRSNTSVNLLYSDNHRKVNPDDTARELKQKGSSKGLTFNTNGLWNANKGWFKSLNYVASFSYTAKESYQAENQTTGNATNSMTKNDGTILSNHAGVHIYDENGNAITNFTAADAGNYAYYIPAVYREEYRIDGEEWNVFAKVNATFAKKSGNVNNRILVGADFKSDGNTGDGMSFAPESAPLRSTSALYASFRSRPYKDIPFVNQLGAYLQDNFTLAFGRREFNLTAGVRYDNVFRFGGVVAPRVNASVDIVPEKLTLRGGYGVTAKAPTLLYLYPDDLYVEFQNFNSMADSKTPESQRLLLTTTHKINTENPDIEIARNRKAEVGVDLKLGQVRLGLTAFSESMTNGYDMSTSYVSRKFDKYALNGALPADPNELPSLKKSGTYDVLLSYRSPSNNAIIKTRGIEMDLNLGRIKPIRTSFIINGAWMRTETSTKDYTYESVSSADLTKEYPVGVYERGMSRHFVERLQTSFVITHNIPSIGLVATLTADVLWRQSDTYRFGNDSIPTHYISADGNWHEFDQALVGTEGYLSANDYNNIKRKVDVMAYIRETYPPILTMNFNVTKEFGDILRVSFFANNMFNSKTLFRTKRTPTLYTEFYRKPFFGLELSLKIK